MAGTNYVVPQEQYEDLEVNGDIILKSIFKK
jgi:hypothetical protein